MLIFSSLDVLLYFILPYAAVSNFKRLKCSINYARAAIVGHYLGPFKFYSNPDMFELSLRCDKVIRWIPQVPSAGCVTCDIVIHGQGVRRGSARRMNDPGSSYSYSYHLCACNWLKSNNLTIYTWG